MFKKYGALAATMVVGMAAGGLFGTGCGTSGGETCTTDADCSVAGETCRPSVLGNSTCGCDPTAAVDSCTEADSTTACHPDREACEATCASDADCLTAGEKCDTQTKTCRDPAKFADCTMAGFECTGSDVCDETTGKCVSASCLGVTCDSGEVCDPGTGTCIEECISNTDCDGALVCNPASGLCEEGCDVEGSNIVCDDETEVCNEITGLCVDSCEVNADCGGDTAFCNSSNFCETLVDISDCNPEGTAPTTRQYVDPDTNQCTNTTPALDSCTAASNRGPGNAANANGPTIWRSESYELDATGCGGAPLVKFFADYYDPTGGVGSSALYKNVFQSVAGNDSFTYNTVTICKGSTGDGCDGVNSDGTRGRLLFNICRPAQRNEQVAFYMLDGSNGTGNPGNSICVSIKAEHYDN